ncbi:MAG: translation initiation factor eIF-1A [Thermoplasmatota archaeon]
MKSEINTEETVRLPLPNKKNNEIFAVVDKLLGGSRMDVSCADGKSRLARIPGGKKRQIKKLRIGDLLIIQPWSIQDEKADVLFSYRKNQARFLSRIKKIPTEIDVF